MSAAADELARLEEDETHVLVPRSLLEAAVRRLDELHEEVCSEYGLTYFRPAGSLADQLEELL